MKFLKQESSRKIAIFASIVLLISGTIFVWCFFQNNALNVSPPLDLSFSATPSPYPLPTLVYDSPSTFKTIMGQIFRKKGFFPNPVLVIQNNQRHAENEYLDLYSENNDLLVNIQWWQEESQKVYEYVSERLDTAIREKVIVVFIPPQSRNCKPRGATFHEDQPIIMIFADQDTSKAQILAVLAHELGHVFIHHKYPGLSDISLDEGLATWAAGDYWKEWKGENFDSDVKTFVTSGTYLPLSENYYLEKAYDENSTDCTMHRDILLTEMASFLDFLIQEYGMESLSSLIETLPSESIDSQRTIYPLHFKDIYGLEFNQLEYEWLKALLHPDE